jgi:molybdopterin molybdotransferase
MGGLAGADALIDIPADVTSIAAGDTVTVLDLRHP